jgi:hypothetical protein
VTKSLLAAAQAYWAATGAEGELPDLPEAPLDALVELLDRAAGRTGAFELLDISRDPYPGIAVDDAEEPWRLLWAIQLAQLEPFVSPALPGMTFLVDTVADPSGRHRVYAHAERPEDALEFASVADALHYMAAQALRARGELDAAGLSAVVEAHATELADEWEEGPSSGMYVLESLLDLPFAEAWDALSRGEWPVVDSLRRPFRGKGKEGWQRAFSLWLVERFLESRVLTLPSGVKAAELDAAHRELVRQLAALEEALHTGLVPELIEQLATDEGRLGQRARAWIARFDAACAAPEPTEPEEEELPFDARKLAEAILGAKGKSAAKGKPGKRPAIDDEEAEPPLAEEGPVDTPFTRKLRAVIAQSLEDMVRREILEIGPEHRDSLVAELVEAAADARSAQHMLKQLTRTLVDSDHVEELYASDDEVSELFRAHMGG